MVTCRYEGKEETLECFKFDGEYHRMDGYAGWGPNGRLIKDYIVKAERKPRDRGEF